MKELLVALAFDHELSLGGTRDYARNLFEPTEALLDLAGELAVPITLFTDILCALRFADWDRAGFYEPYARQLQRAIAAGHDVQLHLHPHWIDSRFEEGRFIPSRRYTLGAFKDDRAPDDIPGIVRRGVELLGEICRAARGDYRCVAYRGGGYHLAPETAAILQALHDQGIRIDSSIAKGMRFRSPELSIDYRGMPAAANWFIPLSGPLTQAAASGIFEVPIVSRPRHALNNIPFLVNRLRRRRHAYATEGRSLAAANGKVGSRLARLFPQTVWTLSFDYQAHSLKNLQAIFHHHLAKHADAESVLCSTVSHPKYMGPYQRALMSGFVAWAKQEYGGVLRFVSFEDIHSGALAKHSSQVEKPRISLLSKKLDQVPRH